MIITSLNNAIIKQTILLKDKQFRDSEGLFIVEGEKIISEIKDNWIIEKIFALPNYNYKGIKNYSGEVILVNDKVINKLSFTKSPQGILAVIRKKSFEKEEIISKGGQFLVLENIQDPGNVGSIIRGADAFDMAAVFISKSSADIYNDKTIRASMGSVFHIPIINYADIKDLIGLLRKSDIKTYASDLAAKKSLNALKIGSNCAFVIGNESKGLNQEIISQCDYAFKINMSGKAQSLNAAIAASIMMYEITQKKS
jgi:TrmH family RNA methyltransferase